MIYVYRECNVAASRNKISPSNSELKISVYVWVQRTRDREILLNISKTPCNGIPNHFPFKVIFSLAVKAVIYSVAIAKSEDTVEPRYNDDVPGRYNNEYSMSRQKLQ